MIYDYTYFSQEIRHLDNVSTLGKTSQNRDIFCIKQGNGTQKFVFCAAFHGLEYLTGVALLDFATRCQQEKLLPVNTCVYFVPLVNPDGADIAIHGINPKNISHQRLVDNVGIIDFCNCWQSNANGVDINHNFNADWQRITPSPAPTKHGGVFPESEPETRAVANLLRSVQPDVFAAFHSQGKEIYYDFNGMEHPSAQKTALGIAEICGYTVTNPNGTAAFGGAKDYYIQEFHKEAFTIELGQGRNPLPHSCLNEMKQDVFKICTYLIRINY